MALSERYKEKIYRAYMEFFEIAERKRRWNVFTDIPWDRHDPGKNSEDKATCVETFCGVELYVPDYTAAGFGITRTDFGHAWFQANWGYEESKHALVFREYLIRSGHRTPEQYAAYERQIFDKVWTLPFPTGREMACYGALQEAATYLIYHQQREKARAEGDVLLETIFTYVSRDEAAHMGFYRRVIECQMDEDREGTIADLARVVAGFQMPGVPLIPDYHDRLRTIGVGLTPQYFLQHGVFPTLRAVGTTRAELARALAKTRARTGRQHGQEGSDARDVDYQRSGTFATA